jgi:hypothetical protein
MASTAPCQIAETNAAVAVADTVENDCRSELNASAFI